MSGDGEVEHARSSRRKRRRPANLYEEYKGRSDNTTWLESHIWHAKRMKMGTKWGYKVALKRLDKGVRAAYRSLNRGCLLSVGPAHTALLLGN